MGLMNYLIRSNVSFECLASINKFRTSLGSNQVKITHDNLSENDSFANCSFNCLDVIQ